MLSEEELRLEHHMALSKITDLELRLDITKSMLSEALKRISDLEDELEFIQEHE